MHSHPKHPMKCYMKSKHASVIWGLIWKSAMISRSNASDLLVVDSLLLWCQTRSTPPMQTHPQKQIRLLAPERTRQRFHSSSSSIAAATAIAATMLAPRQQPPPPPRTSFTANRALTMENKCSLMSSCPRLKTCPACTWSTSSALEATSGPSSFCIIRCWICWISVAAVREAWATWRSEGSRAKRPRIWSRTARATWLRAAAVAAAAAAAASYINKIKPSVNIPLFHPITGFPHIDEIFQVSIKIQETEICAANNKMEKLCARRRNVRKEGKIHTKSINSDIDTGNIQPGVH